MVMDIEIQKQTKVPLLRRERITGYVHFEEVTPSRLNIKKALAAKIKAPEEHVVVRHIYQKYGARKAKVIAHVYADEVVMKELEPQKLLEKNGLVAPAQPAAEVPKIRE